MNIGNYGDETDLQGTLTDGSSTLPAVSFLSDSSTGLYKAADGLGVTVQGQPEANVTVNTTHILNDVRGSGNIVGSRISASTAGSAGAPSIAFQDAPNMGFHTSGNNTSIGVSILGSTLGFLGNTAWSITPPPQLRLSDQSVAFPSYSFSNDTNTGFDRISSDNIGVSTGGVLRATIGNANTIISTVTSLTSTTPSRSTTTGALVVSGGVGIGGNLNVGAVLAGSSAFSDGNVTNPSTGFSNDPNTGIFRLGTDNIAISANGTIALNIASNSANTNSYADAGIFHRIPSYHVANAQLVFNYHSISISSTALNDTSATVLGSIAGNPLITNIGFFSVSNNDTFVNAQEGYCIIFARASFQENSTGSRALFIIADNQTRWVDSPATTLNLGIQLQCTMHYYGSLAGGIKLSVVQNSGCTLACLGHINIVRVA